MHAEIENSFLLLKKADSDLTIAEILIILSGRGYPLLLILFSLPFCQPIQIPGLSTPFGILISFIGLRIAFGHRVWLPKTILEKKLSKEIIHQISSKGLWFTQKISKFTHARWKWISQNSLFQIINGLAVSVLGIILALPLPIPLSNLICAWAILLMSIGLLEDDGVFIVLAYAIGAFSIFSLIFLISLLF